MMVIPWQFSLPEDGISLDKDVTVSLELRTHKTDGILMIADDTSGSPVMSLQLKEGQVGNGATYTVMSTYDFKTITFFDAIQRHKFLYWITVYICGIKGFVFIKHIILLIKKIRRFLQSIFFFRRKLRAIFII